MNLIIADALEYRDRIKKFASGNKNVIIFLCFLLLPAKASGVIEFLIILSSNIVTPENYTLWISRCIAAARERIPGSIENYVTGVSECSQQRSNLKDDGYISNRFIAFPYP
ncbi:hypothetical protein Phpb_01255 [Photorhabdus namnaonensis]|uniref:Uncharacterized protein n=1 Tax=Photorhabdus namnaonensis TaxID=1851568 RepID=A0A1B8YKG6_9GAMM|nr:hypothetical protein Phpb_01255 [Photorhabdus namnaonensis]